MTFPTLAFATLLAALLCILSAYDLKFLILPDRYNFALAAAGTLRALILDGPDIYEAACAALAAGSLFLGIGYGYKRVRGFDGLGLGDAKLAAAGAVWTGISGVGPTLLVATGVCALTLIAGALAGKKIQLKTRIPFGAFLAIGIFVSWSWITFGGFSRG